MSQISLPEPSARRATIDVCGDKSISHRALLLASIADGVSTIRGANAGDDVRATLHALRAIGASIDADGDGSIRVDGAAPLRDASAVVDCANSGTTMRLLAGLLAGRAGATLDGDASLRRRPMERVAAPLRELGADVRTTGGLPPVVIRRSGAPLLGRPIALEQPSAQVKSAVLFAGLIALGETSLREPAQTRDHSERLLRRMGADIRIDGTTTVIRPSALSPLAAYQVPGDISAAFFFIAGAAVLGADLTIRGLGLNPTRTAALDAMTAMGVSLEVHNARDVDGEPAGDLHTIGGSALRGIEIDPKDVPNLIDEIPALCAFASAATGTLVVRGARELRVKESDRIATTASLLRSFGVAVEEFADGLAVRGGSKLTAPERVSTRGDHRIGMSAAILAAAARAPITIDDADCIATSFPGFAAAWSAAFAAP